MARMYPDRIRQPVRDSARLDAECAPYEALRDQLDDRWSVFAWVGWVLKRRGDGAARGEADFVLAQPEHGVVVLGVKGGVLSVENGRWSMVPYEMTENRRNTQAIGDP